MCRCYDRKTVGDLVNDMGYGENIKFVNLAEDILNDKYFNIYGYC